jgi:predicted alpha/beta-fold hydrolase
MALSTPSQDFIAPSALSNAHLQSILPSLSLRRPWVQRRAERLLRHSRALLLAAGDGVKPQGFYSPRTNRDARENGLMATQPKLVVIVHGWEGSAESLYVLSLAADLHAAGCDVLRLNLRDHGDTHHLNRDLFHSCRLAEVIEALRSIQQLFPAHRLYLTGFSLGGNFMLRAAVQAPAAGLSVARVIGISPVLDPATTLDALETGWSIYRRYFVLKWSRSLKRKQNLWPQDFAFDSLLRSGDLRRMTEELVLQHTGFATVDEYFAGYALVGQRLASLSVPAVMVNALDDPIIPAADLAHIARPPLLRVLAPRHGGHCGFFDFSAGPGWVSRLVLQELADPPVLA